MECVERPRTAPTTSRTSWFVYVVRICPPADRDEVLRRLAEAGVPSRPYFTPIHLQPFYREKFGYRRGDFPITETLRDKVLTSPSYIEPADGLVEQWAGAIKKVLAGHRKLLH